MSEQPNIAELRDQIQTLDRLLAEGQAGNTGCFTWHEAYKSRCRKVVKAMGNPEWDAAPDLLSACDPDFLALCAEVLSKSNRGTLAAKLRSKASAERAAIAKAGVAHAD